VNSLTGAFIRKSLAITRAGTFLKSANWRRVRTGRQVNPRELRVFALEREPQEQETPLSDAADDLP
jgi:hypothetical protein